MRWSISGAPTTVLLPWWEHYCHRLFRIIYILVYKKSQAVYTNLGAAPHFSPSKITSKKSNFSGFGFNNDNIK